jgi:hypothetical protein
MKTYTPNDPVAWDGPDGILIRGMEYHVDAVRKGKRKQEFTLKYRNGHKVKYSANGSVVWWEVGPHFIRRQKEEM